MQNILKIVFQLSKYLDILYKNNNVDIQLSEKNQLRITYLKTLP